MSVLRKGGLCPACEKGKLTATQRELVFTYKKVSQTFKDERVYKCDLCDYEAVSQKANQRIERVLTDFRRRVDGLLSGEQMQRIRESLALNKKQMAKLLSVNEKTIGRYENGKITQGEQIDKLYRVLGVYPAVARILDSDSTVFAVRSEVGATYQPKPRRSYSCSVNYSAGDYRQLRKTDHAEAA